MLRLEEGKCYRNVNGQKVGPMKRHAAAFGDQYCWKPFNVRGWWNDQGKAEPGRDCGDLVSEWPDTATTGPTRTVTRTEIVPGVYGRVSVKKVMPGHDPSKTVNVAIPSAHLTADELDAAAAVLTELAKAVRDGQ